MTAYLTWIDDLGSFPLEPVGDIGIAICEGATGWNMPPVELATQAWVGADGSALSNTRYGARTLDLPVEFLHATRARTDIEMLASRLNRGPATLRYTDGINTRDLLNVVFAGGLTGSEKSIDEVRSDVITLVALNPWWHGADQVEILDIATTLVAFDAASAFSSASTAFDGGATTQFTVDGDTYALPVFTFAGPMDAGAIIAHSAGAMIELTAALASGSVITIDTRPGNRGPRLNNGSIDWSLITAESRLFTLPLGDSSINARIDGTSGASSVEVSYSERWLTP